LVKDGVDEFVVLVADANCMAEKMYLSAIDRRVHAKRKDGVKG
jgi:hypothetical protein